MRACLWGTASEIKQCLIVEKVLLGRLDGVTRVLYSSKAATRYRFFVGAS